MKISKLVVGGIYKFRRNKKLYRYIPIEDRFQFEEVEKIEDTYVSVDCYSILFDPFDIDLLVEVTINPRNG